mgnify:CR=1 FL=1
MKPGKSTKEKQYQACLQTAEQVGLSRFGLMSNFVWREDPKRIVFLLSRYKFVAKMLEGYSRVLEVGCADAFGSRIVRQGVNHLTCLDFDPVFIEDARARKDHPLSIDFAKHDILEGSYKNREFEAAYSIDVLEHIDKKHEDVFVKNIIHSISKNGVVIVGTPSLESQKYASEASKEGHVNCKSGIELRSLMKNFFENVFLFSMNDEVVHTGFAPMAHYLWTVCTNPKL